MLRSWKMMAIALVGGLLLTSAPTASANPQQRVRTQQRIVVIEPVPVVDPFFYYGYPPTYVPAQYAGYVKLETHRKDGAVFVDGGYAGMLRKLKKFPLRPGTHTIELRNTDRVTFYRETVNVIEGKTVKLRVG